MHSSVLRVAVVVSIVLLVTSMFSPAVLAVTTTRSNGVVTDKPHPAALSNSTSDTDSERIDLSRVPQSIFPSLSTLNSDNLSPAVDSPNDTKLSVLFTQDSGILR